MASYHRPTRASYLAIPVTPTYGVPLGAEEVVSASRTTTRLDAAVSRRADSSANQGNTAVKIDTAKG